MWLPAAAPLVQSFRHHFRDAGGEFSESSVLAGETVLALHCLGSEFFCLSGGGPVAVFHTRAAVSVRMVTSAG